MRRLILALSALLAVQAAFAITPFQKRVLYHQPPHASFGFLPNSTTTFGVINRLGESNDLTNALWVKANGGGVAVPTVTNVVDTLPDGNSGTVSQIQFPQITTGSGHLSVVDQAVSGTLTNSNPTVFGYWVKEAANACGSLYMTMSVSTTFQRTAIVADGTYHLTTVTIPVGTYTNSQGPVPQIGVNLFDAGQSGLSCAPPVVNVTGGFIITNPLASLIGEVPNPGYSDLKPGGSLANTTTSFISGTVTRNLPAHVRFRNFAGLTPAAGNPVLTSNSAEVYQAGGLSNPYFSQDFQFGGFYWGVSNCTGTLDHTAWMSFCLWKTTDWTHFTEVTTNAPYLQAFGSIWAKPTVSSSSGWASSGSGTATWLGSCAATPIIAITSTGGGTLTAATPSPNNGVGTGSCAAGAWPTAANTNYTYAGITGGTAAFTFASVLGTLTSNAPNYWELHGMFLPGGCFANGASHAFCILFSGINQTQNKVTLYEAYTDTSPDNAYIWVGCTVSGPCSTPTPIVPETVVAGSSIPLGTSNNSLVSIKNVGGTAPGGGGLNYIMVSTGGPDQGAFTTIWTTPADNTATTAGNVLTYKFVANAPVVSGADWDYADGTTQFGDPYIYLNSCGFYEEFTTSMNFSATPPFNVQTQLISYAVTDSLQHPWYRYQVGPIIPATSPMYSGTHAIGDSTFMEIGGQAIWTGNFDNGSSVSSAVQASMPNVTGCP
jgi:hypothetical protein